MKCPRTQTKLTRINVGKVPVFVSEACGGVFLENQTLALFESPQEERGRALETHLRQFHHALPALDERVNCPACDDTVMLRRFYSPLHVVEIDECPGCGGIWLDSGELPQLQQLILNPKERALLHQQLMSEHRPANIEGMAHLRDRWVKRSDKIDKLFELADYLTRW